MRLSMTPLGVVLFPRVSRSERNFIGGRRLPEEPKGVVIWLNRVASEVGLADVRGDPAESYDDPAVVSPALRGPLG